MQVNVTSNTTYRLELHLHFQHLRQIWKLDFKLYFRPQKLLVFNSRKMFQIAVNAYNIGRRGSYRTPVLRRTGTLTKIMIHGGLSFIFKTFLWKNSFYSILQKYFE